MESRRFLQFPSILLSMSILLSACANDSVPAKVAKPAVTDSIVLGMGCFWGAEKRMAAISGVVDVESGYANGEVTGTYESVLNQENALRSGKSTQRNHAEVIRVTFDPARTNLENILIKFWESHNPTQGNRQGNDVGSNYRSAVYTHSDAQLALAQKTRDIYQAALTAAGYGKITTDIAPLKKYFSAEEYHQNYLAKHPNGYCGLGGIGVKYPLAHTAVTPMPIPNASKPARLDANTLNFERQLIIFEGEDCAYCRKFKADILDHRQSR